MAPEGVEAVAPITCGPKGIILPAVDNVGEYTFVGWVAISVNNVTDNLARAKAATSEIEYLKAGDTFIADGNVVLYALYATTEEKEVTSTTTAYRTTCKRKRQR